MRIVLCGKNTAAAEALDFLVARGDEVWAVATAGDQGGDGWQRSFRRAATRLGLRLDQPRRINDPEFVRHLQEYRADLLISIQYDQILRDGLFRAIGCPCLNLHFALLPRHRGVAPIAWALLAGDREAGVTLHHMIEDIDAGDLVAQHAVPIEPEDTARELYEKVGRAAIELFRASYPFPPDLLARRLRQDGRTASYHRAGDFDFSARRIVWSEPAERLQRWIRALIFPPMQYPETTARGRRLAVTRVAGDLGGGATAAAPGTVVGCSTAGIDVATGDGTIRIRSVVDLAHPDVSAAEVMAAVAVGDRLE